MTRCRNARRRYLSVARRLHKLPVRAQRDPLGTPSSSLLALPHIEYPPTALIRAV
jgi:hypothetical protein